MKIQVNDRASYQITQREMTDEGFLRVPGRVARSGVQTYLARELDLDGDPTRLIRVYRPPEEVFDDASLATYKSAVLTNDHPKALVDAKSWRGLSIGNVEGIGRRDGDYVMCDLIFKDHTAIQAIMQGKVELSAGYTAEYADEPGITPEGEPYDYVQRNIRINHVAMVYKGRAGSVARISDHNPQTGGNTMPVLITTDSGRSVDVADPANAQVVADSYDRLNKQVTDMRAELDRVKATADKAVEDLEEARKASTDEAIGARVAAIAEVRASALKMAGEGFTCDSLDPIEIKRAALMIARPKVAWSDKSATYVEAAYDAELEKDVQEDTTVTTDSVPDVLQQLLQLAKDGAGTTQAVTDSAPSAYEQHKARLSGGYKVTLEKQGV